MTRLPIVVGITGASGAIYARRLIDVLLASEHEVHLTISPPAVQVFQSELGIAIDLSTFRPDVLTKGPADRLHYWHHQDFSAGIASGSFRTAGMVIVPCSMSTLASVAHGITSNLITRSADVHLKERRKLIVVPRETPLGLVAIRNMLSVTQAGAVVLPAMPGFYHQPRSVQDLVDFIVGRICDQLGIEADLIRRWGRPAGDNEAAAEPIGLA